MKKKIIVLISAILIALVVIATLIVIKNNRNNVENDSGNVINEKPFEKLINFEIDNEEKVQIIYRHPVADASITEYWNFEFDKKTVTTLYKNVAYGIIPDAGKTSYSKNEYNLSDEEIIYIKNKIEEIESFYNEEENIGFSMYILKTVNGERVIDGGEEKSIIFDVREIIDSKAIEKMRDIIESEKQTE